VCVGAAASTTQLVGSSSFSNAVCCIRRLNRSFGGVVLPGQISPPKEEEEDVDGGWQLVKMGFLICVLTSSSSRGKYH
jgi:hypothetical protein